jgi:chromosome segregation ATPase
MTEQDKYRILEEKINTLNVRVEGHGNEINKGHSQLEKIYSDNGKIFGKLEENQMKIISNEKDIKHSRETFLNKIEDIKDEQTKDFEKIRGDVNAIWKSFRGFKDEIKNEMKDEFRSLKTLFNEQIKSTDRGRRLWMAIAGISVLLNIVIFFIISVLLNIVIFFIAKYWG